MIRFANRLNILSKTWSVISIMFAFASLLPMLDWLETKNMSLLDLWVFSERILKNEYYSWSHFVMVANHNASRALKQQNCQLILLSNSIIVHLWNMNNRIRWQRCSGIWEWIACKNSLHLSKFQIQFLFNRLKMWWNQGMFWWLELKILK